MLRKHVTLAAALATIVAVASNSVPAQTLPTADPTLARIWSLGQDSSKTYPLAQALLDSIGPA